MGVNIMKITYFSFNCGALCTAKVPKDFEKELKEKWKKYKYKGEAGINTFKDFVEAMYSFNL